jgi:hypothetical protein
MRGGLCEDKQSNFQECGFGNWRFRFYLTRTLGSGRLKTFSDSYCLSTGGLIQNLYSDREILSKLLNKKVWLPGMDSNHELDRFFKACKLLISQSR